MNRMPLFLLAILLASPLAAQSQSSSVGAGDRLRVRVGNRTIIEGALMNEHAPLHIRTDTGLVVIEPETIRGLYRYEGRRSRAESMLRGAGLGLLIGGGAGFVLGYADGDDPPGWFSWTAEEKAAIGAAMMGTSGLVVGGIVGLAWPTEVWQRLDPTSIRLAPVTGRRGGTGVVVSLSITH